MYRPVYGSVPESNTMQCNCATPQMKTITCFNNACLAVWVEERGSYERDECPVHTWFPNPNGGICLPIITTYLCDSCQNNGYYLERDEDEDENNWLPKLVLRKK